MTDAEKKEQLARKKRLDKILALGGPAAAKGYLQNRIDNGLGDVFEVEPGFNLETENTHF